MEQIAPLHLAIANGSVLIVLLLVSKGAPLDVVSKHYQMTPLQHSIDQNSLTMVKYMVNHGAFLNGKDKMVIMKRLNAQNTSISDISTA